LYTGTPQHFTRLRNSNFIRKDSQEIVTNEVKEPKVSSRFAREETEESTQTLRDKLVTANIQYRAQNQTNSYFAAVFQEMNPFRKLGIYNEMPEIYYNHKNDGKLHRNTQYIGIKHNHAYCDAVDLYNLHNPDNIFKNMNFISDYAGEGILLLTKIGLKSPFRTSHKKGGHEKNWE